MNPKLFIRKLHRYIGLVIGIQLFFWSLGGLFFSLIPIEEIHGDHLVDRKVQFRYNWEACSPLESTLANILSQYTKRPRLIESKLTAPVPYIRINNDDYYAACNGDSLSIIELEELSDIANRYVNQAGNISEIKLIESVDKDDEFRGKPLPAYKISFDGEEALNLYLHPLTGEVITARTSNWRIFDFLWMLHIMDYEGRDNFNHLLLQIAAAIAVLTSISGLVLWWISRRRRR